MAFDISTAKPVGGGGFDLSTAKPVGQDPDRLEEGSLTEDQFSDQFGQDTPDVFGIAQESAPIEDSRSLSEQAIGAGEAALTAASGATLGVIGTIDGTLRGLAQEIASGEFGSRDAAQRIMDKANELASTVTYNPKTEAGQEYVQDIGDIGNQLAPLAGLSAPIQHASQLGRAAAPQVANKAASLAKNTSAAGKELASQPGGAVKSIFSYQSPAKQRIGQLIEQGSTDVDTARFKIDSPSAKVQPQSKVLRALGIGSAKIGNDDVAIKAINQGFDEGVIASVKGATPADKGAMRQMVNIYQKGLENAEYRASNRPTDVIGRRVVDTFNTVKAANKKAGMAIDRESNNLRGNYDVDSLGIGERFAKSLDDIGISIGSDRKLSFKGSDIEDLPAAERTFNTVFKRMTGSSKPDAYELHRMKRFIDEQVSYGSGGEGLKGVAERTLKSLRKDIDETLDKRFPDYDEANSIYSDTIGAIDDLQAVAGKKINLSGENADKALGTLMRRVLSNAASRVNVIDAVLNIDEVARKHPGQLLLEGSGGTKKKPSINQLIIFADELDSRFGPSAKGSFQGQIEQVANRGRGIAQAQSPTLAVADEVVRAGARGLDKVTGVSDKKALKAIRDLLQ